MSSTPQVTSKPGSGADTPAATPAPPALPARSWIGKPPHKGDSGFTVASYNILAPTYANGFTYCPDVMMAWPYRWGRILAEIDRLDADVIGFQEMEGPYFAADVLPALKARGYDGVYLANAKRGFDIGVALFFRTSAFSLAEKTELRVGELSKEPEMLSLMCGTPVVDSAGGAWTVDQARNHRRFWSFLQYFHHAGLAFVLRQTSTGRSFVACVMHAYWDPTYPEQKASQMALIAHGMERLRLVHGAAGALLLGDFNFMPMIVRDPRYEDVGLIAKLEGGAGCAAALSTAVSAASVPTGSTVDSAEVAAVEAAVRAASASRSSVPSGGYLLLTSGSLPQEHPHHPFTRKASTFGQATPQAPLAASAASAQAAAAAVASIGVESAAPAAAAAIAAAAQAAAATAIPAPSPVPATPSSASGSASSPTSVSASGSAAAAQAAVSAALSAAAAAGVPADVAAAAAAAAAASVAPPMHPDSALPLHIPLRFTSSYAAVAGGEPDWTNWHFHGFRECLDYILVATHTRSVTAEPPAAPASTAGAAEAAGSSPKPRSPRGGKSVRSTDGSAAGDDGISALVPPKPKAALDASSNTGSASGFGSGSGSAAAGGSGAGGGGGAGADAGGAGDRYKPPITGLPTGGRIVTSEWKPLAGPAGKAAGGAGSGSDSAVGSGSGSAAAVQLRAVGVLGIPSTADMLKLEGCAGGGCPNAGTGSDHIPIAARLQWVPVE